MPKSFYDTFVIRKTKGLNKKISILGCGWLGLPLAIRLIGNNWTVKGSTTTPSKIPLLRSHQIDAYLVQLGDNILPYGDFFESDILLINIPPSLKKQSAEGYLKQMYALKKQIEQSPVTQVIFISSTSVYPDTNRVISGANNADSNSALYQSEQLFRQSKNFTTTIIRFAGLIGPGRSPARFFSGKTNIPNGRAPVNLIHLDDCIGVIESILNRQHFGQTYHAAAPAHPSRNEFYTHASQAAGLPLPGFIDELNEWKIIDPDKLINDLNYQFLHSDLMKLASGII